MSATLVFDDIHVAGVQTAESLDENKQKFKGVIYMTTDSETDQGAPGGFEAVKKAFPEGCSIHIPMDVAVAPYSSEAPDNLLSVRAFVAYEKAILALPRPLLVTCKSGARAAAVVAVYKAAKQNMCVEQVQAFAEAQGLGYLKRDALVRWVNTTVKAITRKPLIFRQLFEHESSTYTFVLADPDTRDAILIDPVLETVERDAKVINELGLNLKYALNTHCHADHITGTHKLKGLFPQYQSMIAKCSGAEADLFFSDGDKVEFGNRYVHVFATPGHTNGCTSFLLDDFSMVFTGDAVFIRGCGRTDFQQGDPSVLYDVIHEKIFTLPANTELYPGHDYKGCTKSTVHEERTLNPRLTKSKEEFIDIMNNLNLPYPKKIDASLPANLKNGRTD